MSSSFLSVAVLATAVLAAPFERAADGPQKVGDVWVVDGAGSFTESRVWDFTTLDSLPDGLEISTDHIDAGDAPYAQQYTTDDVYIDNGALNLLVPGGQTGPTIDGAQLVTTDELFYGSIRTIAKASSVAGTCHGFFSYNDDNLEETDIELLTSDLSVVHYTNQNPKFSIEGGQRENSTTMPAPDDATEAFHEYRTDWLPGRVRWYLDGEFQAEIEQYTPTTATPWLWNNWSNGDDGWSSGPPEDDNILQIQRIELYYNTTSSS